MFFSTAWEVHYNSAPTGIRLIGPKPEWARADGGEAGLHPSNLHDITSAIGTVDFTGDMPIILGPDGPSLGGFVCPATVVAAERCRKMGQLCSGAPSASVPIDFDQAASLEQQQREVVESRRAPRPLPTPLGRGDHERSAARLPSSRGATAGGLSPLEASSTARRVRPVIRN